MRWAGRPGNQLIHPDKKSVASHNADGEDGPDENCQSGKSEKFFPAGDRRVGSLLNRRVAGHELAFPNCVSLMTDLRGNEGRLERARITKIPVS